MPNAIDGLKPAGLWKYFAEISKIPRPSKHEAAVAAFVVGTAKKLGLEVAQDPAGTVVVRKPPSKGLESRPMVCLQGHLDMVPEKRPDKKHDFLKDPITLVRKGNTMMADGTTLGADNGVAVATSLAIMADASLVHGTLEFLFTIDEQTGLTGAHSLQPGFLKSQILLNLDSEEEGAVYVGCSGGRDTMGRAPEAEPFLRAAADNSKDVAARLVLVDYYLSMKRNDEGRRLLTSLMAEPKHWATAKIRMAGIEYSEGRTKQAHDTLQEVLSSQPGNAEAELAMARQMAAQNQVDEAIVHAKTAVAAEPRAAGAHYLVVTLYAAKKDAADAITAFEEVGKLNPRAVPAQLQIARLRLATGKPGEAVELAEQAVGSQPQSPPARHILAQALVASRGSSLNPSGLSERFPISGNDINLTLLIAVLVTS